MVSFANIAINAEVSLKSLGWGPESSAYNFEASKSSNLKIWPFLGPHKTFHQFIQGLSRPIKEWTKLRYPPFKHPISYQKVHIMNNSDGSISKSRPRIFIIRGEDLVRQHSSRLSMFCRHLRVAGLAQGPTQHTQHYNTQHCPQVQPKKNTTVTESQKAGEEIRFPSSACTLLSLQRASGGWEKCN